MPGLDATYFDRAIPKTPAKFADTNHRNVNHKLTTHNPSQAAYDDQPAPRGIARYCGSDALADAVLLAEVYRCVAAQFGEGAEPLRVVVIHSDAE